MIIIFSILEDFSTYEVIKWLHFMGEHNVIRVNSDDDSNTTIHIQEGDFFVQLEGKKYSLKDLKAVWYRKGARWLCNQFDKTIIEGHQKFTEYLSIKTKKEEQKLADYLHYIIESTANILGSAFKSDLNKLITLNLAKSVGLLVPDFHVLNRKKAITELLNTEDEDFITKSMSDGIYLFEKKESETGYFSYTEQLTQERVDELPEKIAPSFIQKKIDKDFELRIFFLEDTCYAMAIFSQSDEQTKVDFRKYNDKKPNRTVPFILPKEIDQKIKKLFTKIGLNTGSVDMMVDKKGDFYFLEINPVGQFGMVSIPCNYFLEKKVAIKLFEDARRSN